MKKRPLLPSPGAVKSRIQCREEHKVSGKGRMVVAGAGEEVGRGSVESSSCKFRRLVPSPIPVNALKRARAFSRRGHRIPTPDTAGTAG